jgi:SAM-dependent methyltransferase
MSTNTMKFRRLIRALIPQFILTIRARRIRRNAAREADKVSDRLFENKSPKEVFTTIYEEKLWGKDTSCAFYSGSGSHDQTTVALYVAAIQSFISRLPYKPNALDLGCGDFNVGIKIRKLCNQYVACDVVASLIERNRLVFSELDVDFRCMDMCDEDLPSADIVFVRQVFQHLTNQQILSVVSKLKNYKFLIITEGLPARKGFIANQDKPIGDGIRYLRNAGSGIVLTQPPFSLAHKLEMVLCEVPCGDAVIRTTAYQIQ